MTLQNYLRVYSNDIEKAKACMLAKEQAFEASSKAKVEPCGSKVKVEACKTFGVQIPSTMTFAKVKIDNESTDMETTNKRNTDKDCIVDFNFAMSKGLPNVTTWDEIEKKMGARKSKTYAYKAKGKRKVSSCTLHLQLAYAHCIYTLHLYLAFSSKHLHIAFADCICTLHLCIAFAACICTEGEEATV
ncbi:hypothetical protein Tco_1221133 [Tanacetum coccineum]